MTAAHTKTLVAALKALEKIVAYEPMTFAECSDAEAVMCIAKDAAAELRSALREPVAAPISDDDFCLETMNFDNFRGYDYGCAMAADALARVLDGKDTGAGVGHEPWETLRRRVLALMKPVAELPAAVPLSETLIDALIHQQTGNFGMEWLRKFARAVEAARNIHQPSETK